MSQERKVIPGKVTPIHQEPVKVQPGDPFYVVRIAFRHRFNFGSMDPTDVLEYRTRDPLGTDEDALDRVCKSLGYLNNEGKPTEAARNLPDSRRAHVQILSVSVFQAPGPAWSTSDPRFLARIE